MENSLSDYLRVIETAVPGALVSPAYLSSMKKIAERFPAQISSMFGFECRLGVDNRGADLAFSILPEMVPILKDIDSETKFWPENDTWCRVRDVIHCLEEPVLKDVIGIVWLEFDMEEHSLEIPAPGVFFSFERYFRHHRLRLPGGGAMQQCLTATEQVVSLLRGRQFFKKIRPAFTEALRLLPASAMLFQIGTMVSRPGEYIRLCIQDITPEETISFLERMNWPGSSGELFTLLHTLSDFSGMMVLALDLGEAVLPKVGIEISFLEDTTAQSEPKWKKFLDYLVEKNVSTREKAEAILAYPGHILETDDPASWPLNLRNASLFWGRSIFIRKVDHVKIVYQRKCPLHAKAYLAVYQDWVRKG